MVTSRLVKTVPTTVVWTTAPTVGAPPAGQCDELTAVELGRLAALRNLSPVLEFTDSNDEMERLLFLKWQYSRGLVGS